MDPEMSTSIARMSQAAHFQDKIARKGSSPEPLPHPLSSGQDSSGGTSILENGQPWPKTIPALV